MPIIQFRTLSESECRVLYTIWLIEREGTRKPTPALVAQHAGMTEENLATTLYRLRDIAKSLYVTSKRLVEPGSKKKRGAPPVYYRLAAKRLVTFSDTAKIILNLMQYPREEGRRINYENFISDMMSELSRPRLFIEDKIKRAIQQSYIEFVDGETLHIVDSERASCEEGYLKLLAQHLD